jgi:putative hydrolase of the HAD superfamily
LKALLLDALGTLVRLEPPAPHLQRALPGLSAADAERAIAAEMRYYRAHLDEGRDAASLADLRRRCAEALRGELPERLHRADLLDVLMQSLHFSAFPDARPALEALRARGLRLVVASNWDCALEEVLTRIGLAPLLDGVVASATVGARKPSPLVFMRALELAGAGSADAIHVGDGVVEDIEGAHAAGIKAVLLRRDGAPGPAGVMTIASLAELQGLLRQLAT